MPRLTRILLVLSLTCILAAQEPPKPPAESQGDMKVRISYLNVCSPSDAEKQEIAAALGRIPARARFGPEFEVARGRSTMPDAPLASWVRVRREFSAEAPLSNAQYSISVDEKSIIETVVFRWRDPKDVLQVSLEDSVSAAASPAALLATDTPATRIRVERFGKPSLGLSRCPQADQSAYEPVFASASAILARYRTALGARQTVPRELAMFAERVRQPATTRKPSAAKPTPAEPKPEKE